MIIDFTPLSTAIKSSDDDLTRLHLRVATKEGENPHKMVKISMPLLTSAQI
jgi:hypothetical protein